MAVPTVDFSPLGDLYNTYQQAGAQSALRDFGDQLVSGNTDYRSLAGLAAKAGRPDIAIGLLQQADNKAAGATLANLFGGTSQPSQQPPQTQPTVASPMPPQPGGMASVGPVAGPSAIPRPEVTPTNRVWGDKEAEAAGLYEPSGTQVAQNAVPLPRPRPAEAPAGALTSTPAMPAVSAPQPPQSGPQGQSRQGTNFTVLDTPATQGMPDNVKKALPIMLASPQYSQMGIALMQKYINPEQFSLVRDGVGNILSRNNSSGEYKIVAAATPQMANAAASGIPTPLGYEAGVAMAQSGAKNTERTPEQKNASASGFNSPLDFENAKIVAKVSAENSAMVPEQKLYQEAKAQGFNGSEMQFQAAREGLKKQAEVSAQNNAMTPEQKNAGLAPNANGVNPIVSYHAAVKTAEEAGKAQGDTIGEVIKSARPAAMRIQQLNIIGDALQRGNGNITTGPFAEFALKSKEAIGGLFGVDLKGVPEAEVAQKTGLGLAIQTVKELTSRGTQFELRSAIANNPGLLLSPTGSRVMINILQQSAQQDIDLAKLAQNPANHSNWQTIQEQYYKSHPIMSPFDPTKPLGIDDLKRLQAEAPAAQAQQQAPNPYESEMRRRGLIK